MDKVLESLKEELLKLKEQLTKKDKRSLLHLVMLKGEGYGFYYSPQIKEMVRVYKKSEMYLMPVKDVEAGKKYIYIPKNISGIFILVPEEEIDLIGFN